MGLADDPIELVPPADVSLAVDDQMPLEMLMSTFDRDEMRQYVQRQEIVKSLHLQAPGGFAAASQSIVVAQISDPKLHSSTSPTVVTPAKPKRKQVRRVKKEQENSTPDTQQRRKQRDGTGKGCSTPQPSSRAAKKLATEANRPSGIPTARHASASTVM
ncbi:Uncharacterized protein PBTT_03443 [Plasmodiophora brassicae]|nr:hypothetical protein PBRA_003975 [Plasmodiophora brassicae]